MKGEDRLSYLPKSLRNHIVSFLPMEDALRISILSREWRNICSSLSNLRFDYEDFQSREDFPESFVNFVDRMLLLHDKSDIHKLKLSVGEYHVDMARANLWITFSIIHNVRVLDLDMDMGESYRLPSCLFTSKSLTELDLSLYGLFFKLPTNIHLPNLKTLILTNVAFFDDNSTHKLFSSCPELEHLTIDKCTLTHLNFLCILHHKLKYLKLRFTITPSPTNFKIRVSSSTLQHIEVYGDIRLDYDFDNLSSLLSATISLFSWPDNWDWNDLGYPTIKILKALFNATDLALMGLCIENLCKAKNLSTCLPTFCENLKTLKLTMSPSESHVQLIALLIRTFPNLEDLSVDVMAKEVSPNILNQEWESFNLSDEGMLDHLKKVRFNYFQGSEIELNLVKVLLENAKELNEMKISYGMLVGLEMKVKICQKLNAFTRSSSIAKVLLPDIRFK